MRHALLTTALLLFAASLALAQPAITARRVPHGGIQPQVAVDAAGTVHLLYFRGPERGGDIFYVKSTDGGDTWTEPVRVNSEAGSAVAVGNIRGGKIAVGSDGVVHATWNGAAPSGDKQHNRLFYARLGEDGKFTAQRNVMTRTHQLDGGADIAAGENGQVVVAFHAAPPGATGEAARRVYITRSLNGGASFAPELAVDDPPLGACGCCSLAARLDDRGRLTILYRTADGGGQRDMRLLVSDRGGEVFHASPVDAWAISACPMSAAHIAAGPSGELMLAWETQNKVQLARFDMPYKRVGQMLDVPAASPVVEGRDARQKHPVIAVNRTGHVLLAWTEGMLWNQGGAAAWQLFDTSGAAIGKSRGGVDGVPTWSLVAAFARPDGGFVVLY